MPQTYVPYMAASHVEHFSDLQGDAVELVAVLQ